MAWATAQDNQWLTKSDIDEAITASDLTVIGSAPSISSNQWITRQQLVTWTNATSSEANNKWVTKGTITLPNTISCSNSGPYSFGQYLKFGDGSYSSCKEITLGTSSGQVTWTLTFSGLADASNKYFIVARIYYPFNSTTVISTTYFNVNNATSFTIVFNYNYSAANGNKVKICLTTITD